MSRLCGAASAASGKDFIGAAGFQLVGRGKVLDTNFLLCYVSLATSDRKEITVKIHSDTLDYIDIRGAVPDGCYLAVFDRKGFGRTTCGEEGSRARARGFVVRLSGSSNYNMAKLDDKAATWDEWGIFINELFKLDPDALIGHYPTRDNFIEQTQREAERIATYRPDLAPTHSAPWLEERR
jgi:hypothetical protein